MKTTIDLPDDLLVAAKRRAAEDRSTLRTLVERGLRQQLSHRQVKPARRGAIKWVTARGGLPTGVDLASREAMHEWLRGGQ